MLVFPTSVIFYYVYTIIVVVMLLFAWLLLIFFSFLYNFSLRFHNLVTLIRFDHIQLEFIIFTVYFSFISLAENL